ncbi:MAG: ribonuclease HI [Gammaproteobacteria bacterium]|nr:MAG: ribonuclease HI [Gammaproteobacteria bacterium]
MVRRHLHHHSQETRVPRESHKAQLAGEAPLDSLRLGKTEHAYTGWKPLKTELVKIHTDGACRGNPGPGGWGVLLEYKGVRKELYGSEADSTNNRMELMAAIRALESLKRPCRVQLTTDSVYVKKGITDWLGNWKRKGWKTAAGKPVKNLDLWQRLDSVSARHEVDWHWVKGHDGDPGNEHADSLANRAIDELKRQNHSKAS